MSALFAVGCFVGVQAGQTAETLHGHLDQMYALARRLEAEERAEKRR